MELLNEAKFILIRFLIDLIKGYLLSILQNAPHRKEYFLLNNNGKGQYSYNPHNLGL